MIPEWLTRVAAQVPALCIFAWVVHKMLARFFEHLKQRDEVLKEISGQCHSVQRESHDVMKEASKTMGAVGVYLRKLNGGD